MFIEDLSPNGYFATGASIRAVGWLEQGHEYRKGEVPQDFLAKLREHIAEAYQPVFFMGVYGCTLCLEHPPYGVRNLLIPTPACLYVAPELIVHYVERHGYCPPDEFIKAVVNCPPQKTPLYVELLKPFKPSWEEPGPGWKKIG